MKLYFFSIFLAVVSVPVGLLSVAFYLANTVRINAYSVYDATFFAGSLTGAVLFIAVCLFGVAMALMKPQPVATV